MKRLLFLFALLCGSAFGQTALDASSQVVERVPNAAGGTTTTLLAKIDNTGKLIAATTTDINIPLYIVVGGAGSTGNAFIASAGIAPCTFDLAGGTLGDYVQVSTTIGGDCHDVGASVPTGGFTIGQVVGSATANGVGNVLLSKGFAGSGGGLPLLGCASLAVAGTTLGPVTVSGKKLLAPIYIAGYAGGDAASLQFNASGGTAYRYRWLTSSAGSTSFGAGLIAASTDRIKIGAATTTNSRNVDAVINNDPAVNEKLVMFINGQFGTNSAGTQSTLDIGNGAWVSGASTSITSISIISTSNMLAGSKFCVYQLVP